MIYAINLNLSVSTSTPEEDSYIVGLLEKLNDLQHLTPSGNPRAEMQAVINNWITLRPDLKLLDRDSFSTVQCTKTGVPIMYLNYHRDSSVGLAINNGYIDEKTEDMSNGVRFYDTVEVSCSSVEHLEQVLSLIQYPPLG